MPLAREDIHNNHFAAFHNFEAHNITQLKFPDMCHTYEPLLREFYVIPICNANASQNAWGPPMWTWDPRAPKGLGFDHSFSVLKTLY